MPTSPSLPVSPSPSLPPPRREVAIRTADVTQDDKLLIADLDAVAHLTRTTRSAVVAQVVKNTLGPTFAPLIQAA